MKKTVIAVLALTAASSAAHAGAMRSTPPPGIQMKLVYPTAGSELRAGETVTIAWDITGLSKATDTAWCEQEVFVSIDGVQRRLSPEMGADVRKFDWTVPALASDNAFVVLRFGCQGTFAETRYPQMDSAFRIVPATAPAARIEVSAPSIVDVNGEEGLSVSWKGNGEFQAYEVLASYDRGVSFQSLGTTGQTSLAFKAPAGTHPLVRVVGLREDGSRHLSDMVRADVAAAD